MIIVYIVETCRRYRLLRKGILMADEIKTRAELLALLDDSTRGGANQPQVLRDLLLTVHGIYAGLLIFNSSIPQTGITTVPTRLLNWSDVDESDGVVAFAADDEVRLESEGIYVIFFQCCFRDSNNVEYEFRLRQNNVNTPFRTGRKLAANDLGSCSLFGLVLGAAGDTLSIDINSNMGGGGAEIIVEQAQLLTLRIS